MVDPSQPRFGPDRVIAGRAAIASDIPIVVLESGFAELPFESSAAR